MTIGGAALTGAEGPFPDGGLMVLGAWTGLAGLLPVGSAGLEGGGPTGLTLGTVGATGLGAGERSLGLTTLGGAASGLAVGGGSTGLTTGTVEEGTGRGAGRVLFPPLEAGLDSCGLIGTGVGVEADGGLRT